MCCVANASCNVDYFLLPIHHTEKFEWEGARLRSCRGNSNFIKYWTWVLRVLLCDKWISNFLCGRHQRNLSEHLRSNRSGGQGKYNLFSIFLRSPRWENCINRAEKGDFVGDRLGTRQVYAKHFWSRIFNFDLRYENVLRGFDSITWRIDTNFKIPKRLLLFSIR